MGRGGGGGGGGHFLDELGVDRDMGNGRRVVNLGDAFYLRREGAQKDTDRSVSISTMKEKKLALTCAKLSWLLPQRFPLNAGKRYSSNF